MFLGENSIVGFHRFLKWSRLTRYSWSEPRVTLQLQPATLAFTLFTTKPTSCHVSEHTCIFPCTYGSHCPGGIFFQKLSFFFQSLTDDFSYMVHCRDPIFFLPVALNYLLEPGNVFFITLILDRGPMLLWGKMCPYLLSKHTFYPIAT